MRLMMLLVLCGMALGGTKGKQALPTINGEAIAEIEKQESAAFYDITNVVVTQVTVASGKRYTCVTGKVVCNVPGESVELVVKTTINAFLRGSSKAIGVAFDGVIPNVASGAPLQFTLVGPPFLSEHQKLPPGSKVLIQFSVGHRKPSVRLTE